jgi:hypothetical protein
MATDYTLHEGFPDIPIEPGMRLRLNAVSPTTGNAVAGVTASVWSIYGRDTSGAPLPDVVPLYTAEEIGEPA